MRRADPDSAPLATSNCDGPAPAQTRISHQRQGRINMARDAIGIQFVRVEATPRTPCPTDSQNSRTVVSDESAPSASTSGVGSTVIWS